MVNFSCRWGRKIRKSIHKRADGRGAGGSLDLLLGSFGGLESMNRVRNIMLEKHLDSLNLGYQGQASLQQRKGMNMQITELTPTHRYRRKIMKTSLCTHPASMPVPTLLTTHSSFVGVAALAGLLLASLLAIARPCRMSRANT